MTPSDSQRQAGKHYVCTNCGYTPTNKGWYCDMGCGRDYNRMIDISDSLNATLSLHTARAAHEAAESVVRAVEASKHCGSCTASWDENLCIGAEDSREDKRCDCHAFIDAARLAASKYEKPV